MDIQALYQLFRQHPSITTDSRNCLPGSIFFALKGENFDGNKFALQALEQGCAYAVIDNPAYKANDRCIVTENCLQTLQQLANYHRSVLKTPVIAITGTNGKTTTKELTSTALGCKYRVLYTQGNFNNHIGVPLTLLKLTEQHQMAIIEMGANHPGEIRTLAGIAEPDYGVITNVARAHLEGFGSFEGVIRTKSELYDFLRQNGKHVFVNRDNPYLYPRTAGMERTEYGTRPDASLFGQLTDCNPYLSFWFEHRGERFEVHTHLIGNYNLENALAAICIATYFRVDGQAIARAISAYTPQNRRSQLQKGERNTLIIDAYNANPTSMEAAISNFAQMEVAPKALLLGDMRELGTESAAEHQKIVDLIGSFHFDRVYLAGSEFSAVAHGLPVFPDTDSLLDFLKAEPLSGYHILIKGSNSMHMERCIDLL